MMWGRRKRMNDALMQVFCILLGLVIISPVIYCVLCAFMREREIISYPPQLFPSSWYTENFATAWQKSLIPRFILNSVSISLVCSAVRVFTASMAGFAFAFFEFRGKKLLFFMVLGTMLIPPDATVITNYFTIAKLGLVDNYLGIMLLYFVSAMNIFLMRQNFLTVSKELKEASEIDGCGSWRFYWRILLPVSKPAVATVFISSFVSTWNIYLWPLLVTNRNEMRTVQVGITMLNFAEDAAYGATMAGAAIVLIPSLFIFLIFQKQIAKGITAGSVKG